MMIDCLIVTSITIIISEETTSTNISFGFLLLFLLFLSGGFSNSGASSSSGSRGGTAGGEGSVEDDLGNVGRSKSLVEETRPVGSNGDVGGGQDGGDLIGSDGNLLIAENESGKSASQLGGLICCDGFDPIRLNKNNDIKNEYKVGMKQVE